MVKRVIYFVFAPLVVLSAVYLLFTQSQSQISNDVKQTKVVAKPVVSEVPEATFDNEDLPDFSQYVDVKKKKREFFGYLAPLVRQINKETLSLRSFVQSLDNPPTSSSEKEKLARIVKKFDIEPTLEFADLKSQLLLRVDALPVELVLMQAANESAWGTSRFALEANNLFGQWCFRKGCGLVPTGRPKGEKYEVRKFKHPVNSIRSYFNNLNTGHAYDDFREIRLKQRQNNKPLNASKLAEGLLLYSIRREAYVEELQAMIRINAKYIPKAGE